MGICAARSACRRFAPGSTFTIRIQGLYEDFHVTNTAMGRCIAAHDLDYWGISQ